MNDEKIYTAILRGINLNNGYASINWNKDNSTVDIKIFNNQDELVFTGKMTGYDFSKALLSDKKAPIEGTFSYCEKVPVPEHTSTDERNIKYV